MKSHGGKNELQPPLSGTWPPSNGLSTHVVSRQDTILSISARTTISAPASIVWSILLDTSNYQSWNSFCPSVTIHSQPDQVSKSEAHMLHLGTSFTFNVIMDPNKPNKVTPTQLRITDVSTPEDKSGYVSQEVLSEDGSFEANLARVHRIAWTTEGGFVARGLRSERFHEIIALEEGQACEVRTWECQGGILARAVKHYYKDILQTKFADWCADLRVEAERRNAGGGTA